MPTSINSVSQEPFVWVLVAWAGFWAFSEFGKRSRTREMKTVAQGFGFLYSPAEPPLSFQVPRISFYEDRDTVRNVLNGMYKGKETLVFDYHANRGRHSFSQTVAAFKTEVNLPMVGNTLSRAAEFRVERIDEWMMLYRAGKIVKDSELRDFLDDALAILSFSEPK